MTPRPDIIELEEKAVVKSAMVKFLFYKACPFCRTYFRQFGFLWVLMAVSLVGLVWINS